MHTVFGRRAPLLSFRLRDLILGRPISTSEDENERIGAVQGIGVLGLDALASASYGPEALLTVLLPLGALGVRHALPLSAVIIVLLLVVAASYRQTIQAYPGGGGAYTVTKENIGRTASLFAAAALALDYILNVAVAISAGVGALVSVFPPLLPHTLAICLAVLATLTLLNLRGVRTTGLLFIAPTYLFLFTLGLVVAIGIGKAIATGGHVTPVVAAAPAPAVLPAASAWLLIRAFANGCTAMTGIEAVSNGTPLFHPPCVVGARRTMTAIVTCLVALLAGIATLAVIYQITATSPGERGYESLLSRLTGAVIGKGVFYDVTMASIIVVLALSANTSFAGFPRVCRLLAADCFLPEPFVHRGRRLVFSHGILALAAIAAVLLILFRGVTDALIPLFAIGALSAFTASQAGMVAHWRKATGRRAVRGLLLNGAGAIATAATFVVVLVSKLTEGAWISVLLVLGMVILFRSIRRHYELINQATEPRELELRPARHPIAVVPMRRWDAITIKAMELAMSIAEEIVAVQVLTGDRVVDDLSSRWGTLVDEPSRAYGRSVPRLVVLASDFRKLHAPVLEFVRRLEQEHPEVPIAVIIPQLIELRWYHRLLHGHAASMMKTMLLLQGGPQTVVINAPFYLRAWRPERAGLKRWRVLRAATR